MLRHSLFLVSLFLIACMCSFLIKPTRVIFFGDSITEMGVQKGGYIDLIKTYAKDEVPDHFEFIGAGVGGNKVYDLYLRMEEDVLSKSPDIVVIYIGINDIWHKRIAGTGTDADKFDKFYRAIIKKLKEKKIEVILCTPTVIGERTDNSNEQDGELNHYSNIIRNLAQDLNLPLVDLRKTFLNYEKSNNAQNLEKGILTTDRVHLNATGNQLVAEELWKILQPR